MANFRLGPDLGAPLTVAAADLISERQRPDWNEGIAYTVLALGYIGGMLARGATGDFLMNMGVASLPWAARHIAARSGMFGGASRVVRAPIRRLTRYPAPAEPAEFSGARLV